MFAFDAFTFIVAIAFVWRMAPSPPHKDAPSLGWSAIAEGFRFLKGKRVVQSVFLADLNAMVFAFPVALFPAVATDLADGGDGAAVLGLLTAAPAVGAFLATAFSGRAKHVRRQGRAILLAIAVWGGAIVVFGFSTTLWLSLLMLAIAGMGDMVSGIFRHVDPADGGRGAVPGQARRHRDGGVGHGSVDRQRGIGRRGDPVVGARSRSCWPASSRSWDALCNGSPPASGATTPPVPPREPGASVHPLVRGIVRLPEGRVLRGPSTEREDVDGVLAFNQDLYLAIVFIHVFAAIVWVGGAFLLQLKIAQFRMANDTAGFLQLGQDAEHMGQRVFMPASTVVLLAGIAMVWYGPNTSSCGSRWRSSGSC